MIEHKLIFNDNNFEAWDDVNKKIVAIAKEN